MRACEAIAPSERGEFELPDAIGELLADGAAVRTDRFAGARVNVNTPADLRRAESMIETTESGTHD